MEDIQEEEWRIVPGYDGFYEVSSVGRVRSYKTTRRCPDGRPRMLAIHTDRAGYKRATLERKHRYVHQLVALAWLGPVPEGHEVHHSNRIRGDNRPENLEYVTKKFNLANRGKRKKLRCPNCDHELW